MKILAAKYILCCDKNFTILENQAIIFDKKIQEILPISKLKTKEKILKFPILMPALANTHTHLEYSANKASLSYKNFPCWLKSVLTKREFLSKKLSKNLMQQQLKNIILSGVGFIGEISSFGLEDEILANAKIKTRFYCEILGTNEKFLDFAFENFYKRLQKAKALENEFFKPAIAIHSPYSTHPQLAKKALKIAQDENLLVSTHFCESKEESKFLDGKNSSLTKILQMINPAIQKSFYTKDEFLSMFDMQKTLFTHCVHSDLKNLKHIAHCPFSNRLLSDGSFNLQKAKKTANISLGTDGLSSNISLNLWDEMRAALLIHKKDNIYKLAQDLLIMASINGANALGFTCGIQCGLNADFAAFDLPKDSSKKQLALDLILHTKKAKALFINAERIF